MTYWINRVVAELVIKEYGRLPEGFAVMPELPRLPEPRVAVVMTRSDRREAQWKTERRGRRT